MLPRVFLLQTTEDKAQRNAAMLSQKMMEMTKLQKMLTHATKVTVNVTLRKIRRASSINLAWGSLRRLVTRFWLFLRALIQFPLRFKVFFFLPYDSLSSVCIDIAWKNFSVSALLVLKLSFGCPEFNSAVRTKVSINLN